MPKIIGLSKLPDGRLGIAVDMPTEEIGALHLYTADEFDTALIDARHAARQECWDEINAYIKQGELGEPAHSERNGMVLACNIIRPRERILNLYEERP